MSLLTEEEIREVFASAGKDENPSKDVKSSAYQTAQAAEAHDRPIWFENEEPYEFNQDNSLMPYYRAKIKKAGAEKSTLALLKADPEEPVSVPGRYQVKEFDVKTDRIFEYSAKAEEGIADMVEIDELNNATLLYNLYKRYKQNKIYTYVGPILLALNPFKRMDHLYTAEVVEDYKLMVDSKFPLDEKRLKEPHIFAITSLAYKKMMETKAKQAIVISGESGAGKTESAKRAMYFLTSFSKKSALVEGQLSIEEQILSTNPVLEAFGNSKTARNNNSSRFGKYTKLIFSHSANNPG